MRHLLLCIVLAWAAVSCTQTLVIDGEAGPKSSVAHLATLTIGDSLLVPTFSTNVTNYVIQTYVSNSSTVVGVPADPKATVMYIPPLSEGSNRMLVRVTAEDGKTSKDYSIKFYRMGADYTSPTIGTLKYVPAGTFQRDATPVNQSYVSAFRMARTEVTRAQYSNVMGADPSQTAYSTGTDDPVQYVNWYHAIAFCNKLSIREALTPVYTVAGVNFTNLLYASIPTNNNASWDAASNNRAANGYRLPTEMEWMWAAMGANMGSDPFAVNATGYTKAFAGSDGSNSINDYAWYGWGLGGSATTGTTTVAGSQLPNELGFRDMSGNVREWCWDWFAYDGSPQVYAFTGWVADHQGAASGTSRVKRGGSWYLNASYCTVAYRNNYFPYYRHYAIGFRVVRP